jgi:CheY-like chemotaxis protein
MPIVDGLTSAKMIRSFETTHPSPFPADDEPQSPGSSNTNTKPLLSRRAALNGRVPILAVSASLEERDREKYIRGGFDGWLLKPISFPRLSEIMEGIVDPQVRKENLYHPGGWERGGWFEEAKEVDERRGDVGGKVDLKPSGDVPASGMSKGAKIAAASDGPMGREEHGSLQSREQERLLAVQKEGRKE